jgi:hypothetical protein
MAITNGYCTRAEAKEALSIASADTADDVLIDTLVTVASRLIDGYCERFFYSANQTRYYTPQDDYFCPTDDLVSVTTVYTDDNDDGTYSTTWLTTDWTLDPINAALDSSPRPYNLIEAPVYGTKVFPSAIRNSVKVVGVWGFPSVPASIQQACVLLTTTLYASRNAPFGVLGGGDTGQVFRLSSRLHPAAVALIEPYRKRGGFAV